MEEYQGESQYSDSDYVTEGPEDRKMNSRHSYHSNYHSQSPYQQGTPF